MSHVRFLTGIVYWRCSTRVNRSVTLSPQGLPSHFLFLAMRTRVHDPDRSGVTAANCHLPRLFSITVLFLVCSLPSCADFYFDFISFMFMFKTSTPSCAKTLKTRPCPSPQRPPPGSSDPLIKPSSPAVCPEPTSSPKHVSSVTPQTGTSGAKEVKVKVRRAPVAGSRLL